MGEETLKDIPDISIIIPVYNVEKYLESCIKSLINQSIKNVELIFVDDASTDNSLKQLLFYQKKYPNLIKVISCEENRKQGGARNIGIKHARGKYIGFVDSDDFVFPNMYEELYSEIENNNADAAFISAVVIGPDQEYDSFDFKKDRSDYKLCFDSNSITCFCNSILDDNLRKDYIATQDTGGVWSGLYKRDVIVENNVFFPEKLRFEDNYWVSLLRCYLNKICKVQSLGYCYRYNPNGSSKKMNCDYYDDRHIVEHALLNEVKQRGLYEPFFTAWEYLFANRYGINTCLAYITRFDQVPFNKIEKLKTDVEKNFPNWKNNQYFTGGTKEKIRLALFCANTSKAKTKLLYVMFRYYYKTNVVYR